jgi:cupin 2 domain-containing protein
MTTDKTDNWPKNLFAEIPNQLSKELCETLLDAGTVRIERIVSQGHTSPPGFWYDQDESEFVLLLTGAARLRFEDRVIDMKPGDCLNIPAHQRHRVEWTTEDEPTIWLVVFYDRDSR